MIRPGIVERITYGKIVKGKISRRIEIPAQIPGVTMKANETTGIFNLGGKFWKEYSLIFKIIELLYMLSDCKRSLPRGARRVVDSEVARRL